MDRANRDLGVNGPDFLGIGVSRAGTTYLYDRLRAHPQVWLPPLKELHFFDRDRYGWPVPSGRSLAGRCRLLLATVRRHRGDWKARADVRFAWRYFQSNPDVLESYRRYFPRLGRRVVRGEITPDYCDLDEARIAEIKQAFPDLKLLLTLRHPLRRFESQVYKHLAQSDDPSALAEVQKWLDRPAFVASFDYTAIVERWRGAFGPEKLHVAWFERLEEDADGYVGDICRFLGVDPGLGADAGSPLRLNSSRPGRPDRLPRELLRAFAERILPLVSDRPDAGVDAPRAWRRDLERTAELS